MIQSFLISPFGEGSSRRLLPSPKPPLSGLLTAAPLSLICGPDAAAVAELAATRLESGPDSAYELDEDFVGTPAQLVEQMQAFVELGVDYFMLDYGGFPRLTTVELLIDEVLPALNC